MTEEQNQAIIALAEGLQHMDGYSPSPPDDEPVFVVADNCEYEFATSAGRLQLGHLRTLLTLFQKN